MIDMILLSALHHTICLKKTRKNENFYNQKLRVSTR